jgi:hypothetical protein
MMLTTKYLLSYPLRRFSPRQQLSHRSQGSDQEGLGFAEVLLHKATRYFNVCCTSSHLLQDGAFYNVYHYSGENDVLRHWFCGSVDSSPDVAMKLRMNRAQRPGLSLESGIVQLRSNCSASPVHEPKLKKPWVAPENGRCHWLRRWLAWAGQMICWGQSQAYSMRVLSVFQSLAAALG